MPGVEWIAMSPLDKLTAARVGDFGATGTGVSAGLGSAWPAGVR